MNAVKKRVLNWQWWLGLCAFWAVVLGLVYWGRWHVWAAITAAAAGQIAVVLALDEWSARRARH